MRIISKFHDIYDPMMRTDEDRSIIYSREKIYLDENETKLLYKKYLKSSDSFTGIYNRSQYFNLYLSSLYTFKVIIANKLYTGIIHEYQRKASSYNTLPVTAQDIFYDVELLHKSIQSKFGEKTNKAFLKIYDKLEEFLQTKEIETEPILLKYKSPILVLRKCKFEEKMFIDLNKNHAIINDRLKDIEFQKKLDIYQLYQEIRMFIEGVLTSPEKPMPVIPDILKIQSKGFDKYSFRKRKAA